MCDCITTVNRKLAVLDVRLLTTQPMSKHLDLLPERVALRVERVSNSRQATPDFSAAFCPFCGEKYSTTAESKETTDASA